MSGAGRPVAAHISFLKAFESIDGGMRPFGMHGGTSHACLWAFVVFFACLGTKVWYAV